MRAPNFKLLLIVVAIQSVVACTDDPSIELDIDHVDEVAKIREADLAWSNAQAKDGLDGTMTAYLNDAIMLPPNRPMVMGKAAIRAASAEAGIGSPDFSVSWEPTIIEVAESGDFAYAIGTNHGTVPGPCGTPIEVRGKYIEIWRKDNQGDWKIAADMFSSDLPPSRPSCE